MTTEQFERLIEALESIDARLQALLALSCPRVVVGGGDNVPNPSIVTCGMCGKVIPNGATHSCRGWS